MRRTLDWQAAASIRRHHAGKHTMQS